MSGEGSKFVVEYCSCGGAFKVTRHTPEEAVLAEELLDRWLEAHSGSGHLSCRPYESNMARNFWTTRPRSGERVDAAEAVS